VPSGCFGLHENQHSPTYVLLQVMLLRKQASVVTRSSAVALRVSLVGVW
jgi:hypothetical protein